MIPLELNLSVLSNSEVVKTMSGGISSPELLLELQTKYGTNSTSIPDRGIINVLLDEILSPFYIFQMFSVALWFYEEYTKYAIVIAVMSALSIMETVYDYITNFRKL